MRVSNLVLTEIKERDRTCHFSNFVNDYVVNSGIKSEIITVESILPFVVIHRYYLLC